MTQKSQHAPPPISRIQKNLLATSERRLLNWLCSRMPAWVKPDLLTATGVIGAIVVFLGYMASTFTTGWLYLAIAGYVIQWFGDSMDGSLARYRHIERPSFGYFIDHSCDGIATVLILIGIGLSPFVQIEVALVALVGYLLLCIHAFLAARVLGELRLSFVAAGPTELRLFLIALTVAMIVVGPQPVFFDGLSIFDLLIGVVGIGLSVLFVTYTFVIARRLAAEA